jgi:putative sterol carrier protein
MSAEIFTADWADAWSDAINDNADYKKAAAKWEGAIGLVMTPDAGMGIDTTRVVVADLWHGDSRGAEAGDEGLLEDVPFVITASPQIWKSVLSKKTDPIVGLMGGKLKLTKGGLFALLPYAKAAKELVGSAIAVDTSYPEGWD